jgi:MOSC domain-containing protein YiiM
VTTRQGEPGNPRPRGELQHGPSTLVSVNVGLPRTVEWHGKPVRTSIFKSPVDGVVHVGPYNLAGDQQADLSVHGGEHKAVYLYPSEHYAYWRASLGDLAWGAFGENLTTEGLTEDWIRIGDRLRVGTAELVVTQPRLPCFKLGIRFGRADMEKRFLRSGLTGFYLSVAREGEVGAGDPITVAERAAESVTVAEVVSLHGTDRPDREALRRLAVLPVLPVSLRNRFRKQLGELDT